MCCCWSNNNIRRNRYVNDVAIGGDGVASLRPSIFREKLPPTQQQHAQQQQPMHAPHHKTSKQKGNHSCRCSTQTHKRKLLKPCRELHSLQVNDLIAILRTSASRQQLLLAQQQHAQQQQPLHAPHHKTSKKKTDQTAAAAVRKLTRESS